MNKISDTQNHRLPTWLDNSSRIQCGLDREYYIAKLGYITNTLGEKHLSWWEHKGSNQCRICDLIVIGYELIREIDSSTTKSSLDSMNDIDYQYNSVLDQEPTELDDK